MTTYQTKANAARNSTRTGLPAEIKAGGKIWFLKSNPVCSLYECVNPLPEWKMDQVTLVGKKSFRPHWSATESGRAVAAKLAAQLGRTRTLR